MLVFATAVTVVLVVSFLCSIFESVLLSVRRPQIELMALRPMVVVSAKISQSLRRANAAPVTSVEEIRLLTTLGRAEGAVGQRTAGMIVGATYLRQLQVRDVMLPRQQVAFLSTEMTRDEVLTLVRETGHSRFPLSASANIADVYGVVLAKTLLNWLLEHVEETVDWAAVGDEPLIVPETGTLGQFVQTIQEAHRHLAIVVDEYGDVQGIVTLENVLEEIVGDITDEHDMPVMDFLPQDDGGIIVRAHLELRKLAMELGVPWDPDLGGGDSRWPA